MKKKYLVTVNENRVESWAVTYLVEAENAEEASKDYSGWTVVSEEYVDSYTDEDVVDVQEKGEKDEDR